MNTAAGLLSHLARRYQSQPKARVRFGSVVGRLLNSLAILASSASLDNANHRSQGG